MPIAVFVAICSSFVRRANASPYHAGKPALAPLNSPERAGSLRGASLQPLIVKSPFYTIKCRFLGGRRSRSGLPSIAASTANALPQASAPGRLALLPVSFLWGLLLVVLVVLPTTLGAPVRRAGRAADVGPVTLSWSLSLQTGGRFSGQIRAPPFRVVFSYALPS